MQLPDLYNKESVGTRYNPRLTDYYSLGQNAGIAPASEDKESVLVLAIDDQNDFILPGWALTVDGAVADSIRFVEWGYQNVAKITKFLATKDKHKQKSIFHAIWWVDEDGNHPKPFDVITLDDVLKGKWKPVHEPDWSIVYLQELEHEGKRQLVIWPDHCIEDTDGQKLLPAIEEMFMFHAGARSTVWTEHDKGVVPGVEHYGAIRAEVPYPGRFEDSGTNYKLLRFINRFQKIYVAGQAKSHCVLDTVSQIIADVPNIAPKMYLLTDCTSSISGTEEATNLAYQKLADLGLNLVTSSDPVL